MDFAVGGGKRKSENGKGADSSHWLVYLSHSSKLMNGRYKELMFVLVDACFHCFEGI
jgi:hypothetical protein